MHTVCMQMITYHPWHPIQGIQSTFPKEILLPTTLYQILRFHVNLFISKYSVISTADF